MIETTKEQSERASNIVFRAMREMEKIFNTYGVNMATKIESANAIARLAASLDTIQKGNDDG